MKPIKFISIVISILLFACGGGVKEKQPASSVSELETKTVATTQVANRVDVYEFHSTHRCVTCNAIEANTKYTLKTYFAEEMKKGLINYHLVNVDDAANAEIAEKFAAVGTALFFDVVIDGQETQYDLTEFAFMKGTDKDEFTTELKAKIERQLKKI